MLARCGAPAKFRRWGAVERAARRILHAPGSVLPAPLLSPPRSSGGSRRTVTILFADMVGSTSLAAGLDPEAWRAIQDRYFAALRGVIERHGGTVEKFIGDAVMAVFGWPTLHEDDALRAVRAAAELGAR